jgi:hypothetical protein
MRVDERGEQKWAEVIGGELTLVAIDGELTLWDSHHAGVIDQQVERLAGKICGDESGDGADAG